MISDDEIEFPISGGQPQGRNAAARNTYWRIFSEQPIGWPVRHFSPDQLNLIGVNTESESILDPDGRWFEAIPPKDLYPEDIHAAQVERRLGRNPNN